MHFLDRRRLITRCHFAAFVSFQKGHDVGFGDTAVLAGAGHHFRIEIVLFQEPPHGRAGFPCLGRTRRFGRRFFNHDRLFGRSRMLLGCAGLGSRCSGTFALRQYRQHIPGGNGGTILDLYFLEHTVGRRRYFQHDLVGLEIDEVFIATHPIAGFLVPGDESCVGHRLRQHWHFYFNTHLVFRFDSRGLADLLALIWISSAASTNAFCC